MLAGALTASISLRGFHPSVPLVMASYVYAAASSSVSVALHVPVTFCPVSPSVYSYSVRLLLRSTGLPSASMLLYSANRAGMAPMLFQPSGFMPIFIVVLSHTVFGALCHGRPSAVLLSLASSLPSMVQLLNTYPNFVPSLWHGATITDPLLTLYSVQPSSRTSPPP